MGDGEKFTRRKDKEEPNRAEKPNNDWTKNTLEDIDSSTGERESFGHKGD